MNDGREKYWLFVMSSLLKSFHCSNCLASTTKNMVNQNSFTINLHFFFFLAVVRLIRYPYGDLIENSIIQYFVFLDDDSFGSFLFHKIASEEKSSWKQKI